MSNLQLTIKSAVLNKSTELIGKMENYVVVKANTFGQVREHRTKKFVEKIIFIPLNQL